MREDKTKDALVKEDNIAEILGERERLDQIILEKFKKQVTILFTDICGYTQYMETRGDISGRAMLQKHNNIVMPAVERHEGVVIKTIGDAVMATFPSSQLAVKASVDIQKGLNEYNLKAEASNEIHVKIGINTGEAIMDEADVFGDAVNVAARIQSQAGKDQILVSRSVYDQVCGSEDFLCRLHGNVQVKGKAEALELYWVVWQDEDTVMTAKPIVRAQEVEAIEPGEVSLKILQLEIAREDNILKIGANEQSLGEVSTIRHYEEIPAQMDKIKARCIEIVETLNNVNRRGRLTREVLTKLRELGQTFRDELFTLDVKEKIKKTIADHLVVNLDDQLVHVPWELLHDGKQFLCQRFSMGRLVKTKQTVLAEKKRLLARPLKMLTLADPKGDLEGAYQEGIQIRDALEKNKNFVSVSLRTDNITSDFIKEKISKFDLVHFAGHAEYNQDNYGEGGWKLTNGILGVNEIVKMAATSTMPALVFSNACQSARTEEWGLTEFFQNEIFSLANAFLLTGVKHYIGTFWEVLDEPSRYFALEFYKNLFSGLTIGDAMRHSRLNLIKEYGEETIVWASYLLYGDPTFNYMDQIKKSIPMETEKPAVATPSIPEVRAREEVIDFVEKKEKKKNKMWVAIAAGILVVLGVLLWGYSGLLRNKIEKYEKEAITHYLTGNFDAALDTCQIIENKSPNIRLAYLLRGNISLRRGELDTAVKAYEKALKTPKGTNLQKAEALIGLGRIASLQKETGKAIEFYQKATTSAPSSKAGYLSHALLLDNEGEYEQALSLLEKARTLAPEDKVVSAITKETRKKVSMAKDQEKQKRLDKLVKDLLESMTSPPRALATDGWTSFPLTMWIMDFKTQGYSLQEGEERLLISGITDQVLQNSHVQVVERALFDRLLQELKLGTSKLIDRSTALALGKIMAAKLILSGQMVYAGNQTQVSMRLIETETGRITAAINESFGNAVPASILSGKLSENLLTRLEKLYPIRGKILEVSGEDIRINIGQKLGVQIGEWFKVIETNAVLEIVTIETDTSLGKLTEGDRALAKGYRVESLVESK
jgi:class 3 adenylate cyclase/tetratricopeptide (TPR) repeat protein